jgi:hypothetical protein
VDSEDETDSEVEDDTFSDFEGDDNDEPPNGRRDTDASAEEFTNNASEQQRNFWTIDFWSYDRKRLARTEMKPSPCGLDCMERVYGKNDYRRFVISLCYY